MGYNGKLPTNVESPAFTTRFWRKVNKAGPLIVPALGVCWEWTASTSKNGYGQVGVFHNGRHTIKRCHRVVWAIETGDWEILNPVDRKDPTALEVCHKCDNRLCVRPSHLFLGTSGDNNRDAHAKGRGYVPLNKSTIDLELIRNLTIDFENGVPVRELVSTYGLSQTHTYRVLNRNLKTIDWAAIDRTDK